MSSIHIKYVPSRKYNKYTYMTSEHSNGEILYIVHHWYAPAFIY